MFKSNFGKSLKHLERIGKYGEEMAELLTVGGGWRLDDLGKLYKTHERVHSGRKRRIDNGYSGPIEKALGKAAGISRRMRRINPSEELEKDYKKWMESSTKLTDIYQGVNDAREYYLDIANTYLGNDVEEMKNFVSYTEDGIGNILTQFDRSIEMIRNLRKEFKKSGRIPKDELKKVVEINTNAYQSLAKFSEGAKELHDKIFGILNENMKKMGESYEFATDQIAESYQSNRYQSALKEILELENKYPSLGRRIRNKFRKAFKR